MLISAMQACETLGRGAEHLSKGHRLGPGAEKESRSRMEKVPEMKKQPAVLCYREESSGLEHEIR
jgi:hypothetical protein